MGVSTTPIVNYTSPQVYFLDRTLTWYDKLIIYQTQHKQRLTYHYLSYRTCRVTSNYATPVSYSSPGSVGFVW